MSGKTERRTKHVPQRTCVGCHQVIPKRTLIRLVRNPQGVYIDPSGKAAGRGAYLHNRRLCWERGINDSLAHALKVELTDQDRLRLQAFLESLPADEVDDINPDVVKG